MKTFTDSAHRMSRDIFFFERVLANFYNVWWELKSATDIWQNGSVNIQLCQRIFSIDSFKSVSFNSISFSISIHRLIFYFRLIIKQRSKITVDRIQHLWREMKKKKTKSSCRVVCVCVLFFSLLSRVHFGINYYCQNLKAGENICK